MPNVSPLRYDPERLTSTARQWGLRLVLAFGSRVTGRPPPSTESDLDLAVLCRSSDPPLSFLDCYRAMFEVFDNDALDLVLLNDADPLLRYEVLRVGNLLYGDLDDYLEYKAFAYRDFIDSADLRQLEAALFEKKLAYLKNSTHAAPGIHST